jgi:hypothetical protein
VARAVDADADQEVIFLEEFTPFIVQQGAVGLHGVLESHPRSAVFLLISDGLAVEIDSHQGRLATLPGYGDLITAVGLDQLADVGFKGLFGHAEIAIRVKQLLIQEEAIRASQVAGGTAGFGQYVNAGWEFITQCLGLAF